MFSDVRVETSFVVCIQEREIRIKKGLVITLNIPQIW